MRGRVFNFSAILKRTIEQIKYFERKRKRLNEASSLDQIKMTKNWLEFDPKKLTTTNPINLRLVNRALSRDLQMKTAETSANYYSRRMMRRVVMIWMNGLSQLEPERKQSGELATK